MKKYKLLICATALAAAGIAPVIALASCGNKTQQYKAIPESMLNIEANVLCGLKESASIDAYDTLLVPENVVAISSEAFKDVFKEDTNGSTIKTIIFNKNLSAIGKDAFSGCDAITKLDLTKMQDVKIMGLKLGTDSFTTWKNSGGTAVLPNGITDMQKDWIKQLFGAAGLPGSWFGEEAGDQETIDALNELIHEQPFNTMSSMITYVKENTLTHIDLEELESSSPTHQYVWDSKNNYIVQLDQSGNLVAGPKEYTLPKPINLWKMVKPSTSTKLLKSAKKNSNEVYADTFSETTAYSQYLRTDYKETWEENKTLSFQSGLDTGNVEQLQLTYTPITQHEETPVINTMKCSLTINGSLDSIDHYGNLTELTVEFEQSEERTYTEYGSVDAPIIFKQGSITTEAGSQVYSIIVDTTDASTVKIDVATGSDVGTIGATDPTVASKLEDTIISGAKEEVGDIKTSGTTDKPKESGYYYSGDGSVNAPYTIKTTTHFDHFKADVETAEGSKKHYNLLIDIDLDNQEWTPLCGTTPFSGVFNGCGFTISNLKITSTSTSHNVGFFAKVCGTHTGFDAITDGWDTNNNCLKKSVFDEEHFTAILKNINFDNVNISAANHTNKKKCTGALVGEASDTLINNVHVKNATISGYKAVGGIAGCLSNSCIENCSTDENTTISSDAYHVGGIAGAGYYNYSGSTTQGTAVYNCVNNAEITATNYAEGNAAGSVAGIIGFCQNDKVCVLIEDCVNNGKITALVDPDSPSGKATSYAAGICAYSQHVYAINNCTNTGEIVVGNSDTENKYKSCGAGISTFGTPELYNCTNTGFVHGYAQYLGGLFANWNSTMTGWALKIINPISTRQPETTKSGGYADRLAAGIVANTDPTIIENATFANVDELSNSISSQAGSTTNLEFKNCTVLDTSGTLKISEKCRCIKSNTKLCSNVIPTDTSVEIDMPDTNITISGDHSANSIYVWGKNSSVTIEEGASINHVTVGGENATCTNNGTINGGLSLSHKALEATNNGTIHSGFSFDDDKRGEEVGVTSKHLVNKGSIDSINHTIAGGGNASLTLDNYGTITCNATGAATYIFLMYNDASNIINNYAGSKCEVNATGNWIAKHPPILYINYQTGATAWKAGSEITWESLAGTDVIVNHID